MTHVFSAVVLLALAHDPCTPLVCAEVVDAGALLKDGVPVCSAAVSPLVLNNGTLTCTAASSSSGGCVTDSSQHFAGVKNFDNVLQAAGGINVTGGDLALASSAAIKPLLDGNSVRIVTRRGNTDPGPGLYVEPLTYRDAGSHFSIMAFPGAGSPFFSVTHAGDVVFGPPLQSNGTSPTNLRSGTLVDGSGLSGHVALRASPGLYLSLQGNLGDYVFAIETDGGKPVADGGTWVQTFPDGGTYYEYAGMHGDVTATASRGRRAGWLFAAYNPVTSTSADFRFAVDHQGGVMNGAQLTRAGFQPCPAINKPTSAGQYFYGASVGTLMYATDTEHWYVCKAIGWKQLKDEDDP